MSKPIQFFSGLLAVGAVAIAVAISVDPSLVPGHGSVVSPASRVYRVYKSNPERPSFQLAANAVQIDGKSAYYTWNELSRNIPDAVKAKLPPGFDYSKWVPDGQLASGGRVDSKTFPRTYKGLDQVSANWPTTTVVAGQTIDVDFLATAAHSPSVWDVWMTTPSWAANTKLRWSHMQFLGRPTPTYSNRYYKFKIKVPVDRQGHHVMWVAWQRNDPVGEVFFSTCDLLVRPKNNDCAGASVVRDGRNGPFSTKAAAATTPAASCGTKGGGDVWFTYTASCTGVLRADTCASVGAFDSIVSIWSGTCGSLTQIGCDDNRCGVSSVATARVTANTKYFIKVSGQQGKPAGEFDLTVSYDNSTGSFVRSSRGCGAASLVASGAPNIGGLVKYAVSGSKGATQLLWVGLAPTTVLMCTGCTLGTDMTIVLPGAISGQIPCDARLIGVSWYVQGADVGGTTGGCRLGSALDFTLTDTIKSIVGG